MSCCNKLRDRLVHSHVYRTACFQLFDALFPAIRRVFEIEQEFTVLDGVEAPYGKWPTALGNVMVVSVDDMSRMLKGRLQAITNLMRPSTTNTIFGPVAVPQAVAPNAQLAQDLLRLEKSDLREYAFEIDVILQDHSAPYVVASAQAMNAILSNASSYLVDAMVPGLGCKCVCACARACVRASVLLCLG